MIETTSNTFKSTIFSYLHNDITISEIEQFIYHSDVFEKILNPDNYIELISINFKLDKNNHKLKKILISCIDYSEYLSWELQIVLEDISNKGINYPSQIYKVYDMYCDGYYFMQNLALNFGLPLATPAKYNYEKDFYDLSKNEQFQIADLLYPEIKNEAEKILGFLSKGKIIISEKVDDLGRYTYIDKRTIEERKLTEDIIINEISKPKKWWNFCR